MASRKKYYVLLLDVGRTMGAEAVPPTEGQAATGCKLDLALKAAKMFIQQKLILGGKSTQVALVLMGSTGTRNRLENSGYKNIEVIKDLTIPDIDMLQCLSNIHPGSPYSSDIVSGLIIALDMINSATEKSKAKSQRTVLVLTDGCTPIMGSGDLPSVIQQINHLNIEPIITTFGGTPLPEVHTVFEAFIAQSQQGQYLEGDTLMEILKKIKSKDTQQISKCRVDMEVTKYMKIPVWCYVKTNKVTLPTLKKESVDSGAAVKMDRAYFTVDDPDGEAIPAEERLKAYKYGSQYVQFESYDEASLSYHSDKCLRMLGFAKADSIPQELMIGDTVECVAAEPNNIDAAKAMSSLIKAMVDSGVYMLARYCFRNDIKPKYVCLAPHIGDSNTCLYMNQLPFSDDVRTDGIMFDDFDTNLSNKEMHAIDSLMDSMDLEDDGESNELLKMKDIPNPTLLRFWKTVIERVDDPDAAVVGVTEEIDKYLHPERVIEWRFIKDVNALKDVFPLVKVPIDKKKKKTYWRGSPDAAQTAAYHKPPPVDPSRLVFNFPDDDDSDTLISPALVSAQHAVSLFGQKEMFPQVKIRSITPVKDFTTAVYGLGVTSGLLDESMRKMAAITSYFIKQPGYDYVDKAVDCIVAMRDAAICYGNDKVVVMDYNKFIDDSLSSSKCKDNAYLWQRITDKRITYLTGKEVSASDKTDKDAEDFLKPPPPPPQPPVADEHIGGMVSV